MMSSWDHFWLRSCPPHLLAMFRIVFGAFLLFYFSLQLPHVTMLYSSEGVLLPRFSIALLAPPSPVVAHIAFSALLASLLCMTIGAGTRLSIAIAASLYVYYWNLSLFQMGASFDRIFIAILFILLFSGCGKTFSVDMRIRKGSWVAWESISILPQRLLAFQLTATYLGVGLQKFFLPAWQSGDILAWGFVGRWATPAGYWVARLNWPLWFYDVLVWQVKICEILMPIGFWFRRVRWIAFAYGAIFHILIAVLMAIWWFLVLIPAYIVFFEPEEVHKWLKRVSGGRIR